jgi:hypothetical protein
MLGRVPLVKTDVSEERQTEWRDMKWIELAQDRDQWRAVLSTVMNVGFHKIL